MSPTPPHSAPRSLTATLLLVAGLLLAASPGCGSCRGQATLTHQRTPSQRASAQKPLPPQPALDRASENPVVARVGDATIHRSQIEQAFQEALRLRALTGHPVTAAWKSHTRRNLLTEAVETQLLDLAVAEKDITLTERDVDALLQQRIETTFRTRATFERYLSKLGITEQAYRLQLRRDLAVERLLRLTTDLSVSPETVRAWYDAHPQKFQARERVHLATITLRVPRNAEPDKVREIKRRAAQLAQLSRRRGQTFQDLARRHSEAQTAADGGDSGWRYRHNLPSAVAIKAFTLPVGAVSEPIRTRLGYQLIKVLDRRPAGTQSFQEVEDSLTRQLQNSRARKARADLIQRLKARHAVQIFDEHLR